MNTRDIALISEATELISVAQLEQIASALQKQLDEDFAPAWNKTATLHVYENVDDIPPESLRIYVGSGRDNEGFHCVQGEQPFARVFTEGNLCSTCKSCSHELLEMLVDPKGDEKKTGPRLIGNDNNGDDQVNYILEVCDPCQDEEYTIEELSVSDFVFPAYYNLLPGLEGTRYNQKQTIHAPREILMGGYLAWEDGGQWEYAVNEGGFSIRNLPGPLIDTFCPGTRGWVDYQSRRQMEELIRKLSGRYLDDYRERQRQIQSRRNPLYNCCKTGDKVC